MVTVHHRRFTWAAPFGRSTSECELGCVFADATAFVRQGDHEWLTLVTDLDLNGTSHCKKILPVYHPRPVWTFPTWKFVEPADAFINGTRITLEMLREWANLFRGAPWDCVPYKIRMEHFFATEFFFALHDLKFAEPIEDIRAYFAKVRFNLRNHYNRKLWDAYDPSLETQLAQINRYSRDNTRIIGVEGLDSVSGGVDYFTEEDYDESGSASSRSEATAQRIADKELTLQKIQDAIEQLPLKYQKVAHALQKHGNVRDLGDVLKCSKSKAAYLKTATETRLRKYLGVSEHVPLDWRVHRLLAWIRWRNLKRNKLFRKRNFLQAAHKWLAAQPDSMREFYYLSLPHRRGFWNGVRLVDDAGFIEMRVKAIDRMEQRIAFEYIPDNRITVHGVQYEWSDPRLVDFRRVLIDAAFQSVPWTDFHPPRQPLMDWEYADNLIPSNDVLNLRTTIVSDTFISTADYQLDEEGNPAKVISFGDPTRYVLDKAGRCHEISEDLLPVVPLDWEIKGILPRRLHSLAEISSFTGAEYAYRQMHLTEKVFDSPVELTSRPTRWGMLLTLSKIGWERYGDVAAGNGAVQMRPFIEQINIPWDSPEPQRSREMRRVYARRSIVAERFNLRSITDDFYFNDQLHGVPPTIWERGVGVLTGATAFGSTLPALKDSDRPDVPFEDRPNTLRNRDYFEKLPKYSQEQKARLDKMLSRPHVGRWGHLERAARHKTVRISRVRHEHIDCYCYLKPVRIWQPSADPEERKIHGLNGSDRRDLNAVAPFWESTDDISKWDARSLESSDGLRRNVDNEFTPDELAYLERKRQERRLSEDGKSKAQSDYERDCLAFPAPHVHIEPLAELPDSKAIACIRVPCESNGENGITDDSRRTAIFLEDGLSLHRGRYFYVANPSAASAEKEIKTEEVLAAAKHCSQTEF